MTSASFAHSPLLLGFGARVRVFAHGRPLTRAREPCDADDTMQPVQFRESGQPLALDDTWDTSVPNQPCA